MTRVIYEITAKSLIENYSRVKELPTKTEPAGIEIYFTHYSEPSKKLTYLEMLDADPEDIITVKTDK